MPPRRLAVVLLVLLLVPWASAGTAAALYSARVAVADQSEEARITGFREALEQVLVKLSGQSRAAEDPRLAPLLDAAADWVAQYRYQAPDAESEAESEEEAARSAEYLVVEFAAGALDAELRRLGVARWPAARPPLLVWLDFQEPQRSRVGKRIRSLLQERGVRGLEPLWDLQDTLALGSNGLDAARVASASARYDAPAWLLLAPQVGTRGVEGRWSLGDGATLVSGSPSAATLEDWVAASVQQAVDALAASHTHQPGADTLQQRLRVEGVHGYGDYQEVMAALKKLETVRDLRVEQVGPGLVTFVLQLDGDPQLLWHALSRHDRFTPIAQVGADSAAPPLYAWRGL